MEHLTAWGRTDVENEIRDYVNLVLQKPKVSTMDRKLLIEAASPGHFPRALWQHFGVTDMPPCSLEEQVEAIVGCAKAGAGAIHTHPRDPGWKYCYEYAGPNTNMTDILAATLDKVFDKVGDLITVGHAWFPKNWEDMGEADYITETQELLRKGKGNKYIQAFVIITWIGPRSRRGLLSSFHSAKALQEGVSFLQKNDIKPWFALHVDHLDWLKHKLVDTEIARRPLHLNIQLGKHDVDRIFADPWAHIEVINSINLVKQTLPDSTIGIHAGGRNWLPMTVLGIMLGVDVVRVGIEDQFWTYPHKDEFIRRPSDAIRKVVSIAKELGREIATPEEARTILGIRQTSK